MLSSIATSAQKLCRNKAKPSADTTTTKVGAPPMDLEVLCSLGQGSFGHVFKVRLQPQPTDGANVGSATAAALKVFKNEGNLSGELHILNEIEMSLTLSNLAPASTPIVRTLHAHTVTPSQMYDIGVLTPLPAAAAPSFSDTALQKDVEEPVLRCMSMELCEGGDLSHFLMEMKKRRGMGKLILTEKEAASFFHPVAKAIEFCHKHRVLHLDVKPDNVLLRKKGRPETACLSDFSLATVIPANKSRVSISSLSDTFCSHKRRGTERFMAPEMGQAGIHSPLADVYSLGCVLLYALTGAKFSWREFYNWRHLDSSHVDKFLSNHFWRQARLSGERRYGLMWDEELSPAAKSLITGMLCPNPLRRLNLREVLGHPWLAEHVAPQPPLCTKKPKASFKKLPMASCFGSMFR